MFAYQKLCTEFYDLDKPEAPTDALAFYLAHAERAAGPIWEPMCGSGRFLVPLLTRGFDIDGSDASPHMLAACRDRCERLKLVPRLDRGMLQELAAPRQYALVFIPAGSFGLITDAAAARTALERIHSALLPRGTFVLEVERPDISSSAGGPWGAKWVERPDGAKILVSWVGRYDATTRISRNIGRYELIQAGRLLETEFEDLDLRSYEIDEFRELLAAAGFSEIRAQSAYEGKAPQPDDDDKTVVFECRKG